MKQDYKVLGLRNPKDLVTVCYKLVPGQSAAQPFLLEPVPLPSAWQQNHPYSNGEIVQPTKPNGHYYQAEVTIKSGTDNDRLRFTLGAGGFSDNNGLVWEDIGTLAPSSRPAYPWKSDTTYSEGEIIKGNRDHPFPPGDHYYRAKIVPVSSGISEPAFPAEENASPVQDGAGGGGKVIDNGRYLFWKDLGIGISSANIGAKCANISPSQPILMDQILVVAIDIAEISANTMDRFKILNLNITNQQGASLNPTPIRPSLAQGTASGAETASLNLEGRPSPKSYFLTWPNQLPGDTIPTVSVNLVYTPVAPALRWEQNTFYPAGSIVLPNDASNVNGHYYLATNSGISSVEPPSFASHVTRIEAPSEGSGLSWKDMGPTPPPGSPPAWAPWTPGHQYGKGEFMIPPASALTGHYYRAENAARSGTAPPSFSSLYGATFSDGPNLTWKDMGPTVLNPVPPKWAPNTAFAMGAQITPDPPNGHYYQALTAGVTGPSAPPFSVDGATPTIESTKIIYIDAGVAPPGNSKLKAWAPSTAFFLGDAILDPTTGHYFSVVQAGISGPGSPPPTFFKVAVPEIVPSTSSQPIIWQDLGATLPASVSLGVPPSDQTVNLLTYTYPQAHALSRFNLASGVVLSSIRTRSFTNLNSSTAATPNWTTIKNGLTFDPILAVTLYIKPIDAERRFQKSDITPAPTLGFSLTSPTTNFYLGASSEFFVRNLQLVYGLGLNKASVLQPTSSQLSATTPVTRQAYLKGGFIGVSFNITGFIQSLFIPH